MVVSCRMEFGLFVLRCQLHISQAFLIGTATARMLGSQVGVSFSMSGFVGRVQKCEQSMAWPAASQGVRPFAQRMTTSTAREGRLTALFTQCRNWVDSCEFRNTHEFLGLSAFGFSLCDVASLTRSDCRPLQSLRSCFEHPFAGESRLSDRRCTSWAQINVRIGLWTTPTGRDARRNGLCARGGTD